MSKEVRPAWCVLLDRSLKSCGEKLRFWPTEGSRGQQRVECDLESSRGIESNPVLDSWDNLCSGSEV